MGRVDVYINQNLKKNVELLNEMLSERFLSSHIFYCSNDKRGYILLADSAGSTCVKSLWKYVFNSQMDPGL